MKMTGPKEDSSVRLGHSAFHLDSFYVTIILCVILTYVSYTYLVFHIVGKSQVCQYFFPHFEVQLSLCLE